MKSGGRVNYVDSAGERRVATITLVSGTGKSGYKELDLQLAGEEEELVGVPHERDAEKGAAFWREIGAPALEKEEAGPAEPVKQAKKKKAKRK